nr:MAG TPA: hypothetical protein [Caudoviricetes sp.]
MLDYIVFCYILSNLRQKFNCVKLVYPITPGAEKIAVIYGRNYY